MSEATTTDSQPSQAEPATAAPSTERAKGLRKTRVGEVVSESMDKTIIVKAITRVPHPKFGKITKHVKKFYVHDEKNEAKLGDRVSIIETRPLSRLKRWRLVEVLKH
jgi:small subunit ribosomal protein S17